MTLRPTEEEVGVGATACVEGYLVSSLVRDLWSPRRVSSREAEVCMLSLVIERWVASRPVDLVEGRDLQEAGLGGTSTWSSLAWSGTRVQEPWGSEGSGRTGNMAGDILALSGLSC